MVAKLQLLLLGLVACLAAADPPKPGSTKKRGMVCRPGKNMLRGWYNGSRADGPYACTADMWGMLNAYRSGGKRGVHWKFTNDPDDPECLKNWTYYKSDGNKVFAKIAGRATQAGMKSKRPWCALPVYRPGGVRGKQYDMCDCSFSYGVEDGGKGAKDGW